MEYPRFPFSEMHLGKFPDSMEVQSWKVNFNTEVCSKAADPCLTMRWIKEVEIEKSVDELMTSQSILGGKRHPGLRDAGRTDTVFSEKASQLACGIPQKSKC